jgi:oxysterol-binding protein-related protein 9/10/11
VDPYVVEGTWDGVSHLKPKNKNHGDVKGQIFYRVPGKDEGGEHKTLVTALGGEPDGTMGDFETRKLWGIVAKGIRTGDFELASKEKIKIEVSSRLLLGE